MGMIPRRAEPVISFPRPNAPPAVRARRHRRVIVTLPSSPRAGSRRTLQEWEQGRGSPSGAAQALVRIAARRPEIVREALA
jgi:hypothetical protein